MSDDHAILEEIKELRKDLGDFKVGITKAVTETATEVRQLKLEKVQLFTFANNAKDAIGMLRGAGIAITFMCMLGGFIIGYMTYQNSMIVAERTKITTEKREK